MSFIASLLFKGSKKKKQKERASSDKGESFHYTFIPQTLETTCFQDRRKANRIHEAIKYVCMMRRAVYIPVSEQPLQFAFR